MNHLLLLILFVISTAAFIAKTPIYKNALSAKTLVLRKSVNKPMSVKFRHVRLDQGSSPIIDYVIYSIW
jgi:hypothetical protein